MREIQKLPDNYFPDENKCGDADEFFNIPTDLNFVDWRKKFNEAVEKGARGWQWFSENYSLIKILCENKREELSWIVLSDSTLSEMKIVFSGFIDGGQQGK